ncbi:DNA-binding domain-containing protein [Niveibacterium sp. SC-1]|uniref:DNA-binding domain-containing protein n=1 Tax=Niveibacterium sp. SC-1 TaxID=3135646 RepID=UPI0031204D48
MRAPDSELCAAQRAFADALCDVAAESVATGFLAGEAERNRALLALYRGNALANQAAALGNAFPVVRQVVGEEFFEGLARAFDRVQPSRSGNLDLAGEGFADFLAHFAPAQTLPYLVDLAALEWAVVRAWRAADAEPADADWLSSFDMDSLAAARPRLHPALQVLCSDWPVVQIWQQHQPAHEGALAVRMDEAECACVWRDAQGVCVSAISVAEAYFWRSLIAGEPLGAALQVALQQDGSFDLASSLGFAMQHGFICRA